MTLAFILSMPVTRSWNGRWSGEDRLYCILRTFRGVKQETIASKILATGSFGWKFSDGWCASVRIEQVDSATARKYRSKSAGFSGYDWMVESIIRHGRILDSIAEKQFIALGKLS